MSTYQKMGLFLLILVASIIGCSCVSATPPDKRALLIGIDEYKAGHISDLRGCANDVGLMRNVLIGKFDVPPDNILILTNEQATHAGIIEAIQTHLINEVQEGDVVILHYSGHGSQMRDASGDEIDNLDETIVPHDSRTQGVFDINDDQINGLLKQLTAKTKNVTFILDSCHSGAISRAGGSTVRKIDPDNRPPPPPPAYALSGTRGADEGIAGMQLKGSDYVLISGCRANELSNETRFGEQRHGALTWFLTAALQAAGEDVTYQDVMDEVEAEVSSKFPSQHPQLEGHGTDLRVFGTDRINTRPYVLVEPLGGKQAKIDAGNVYGVSKGATLKVFPPQTKDFQPGEEIAMLEVTAAEDFTSTAKITAGGEIKAQSRGVLEAVNFGEADIPVYVATAEGEKLAKIAEKLAATTTLELVGSEADARIIVGKLGDKITVSSGDLEMLVPPVAEADNATVEHVVNQVKDFTHWLMVLDLKNPMSDLQIDLNFRREGDADGTPEPREVTPGTRITYQVTNKSSKPLYLTVLDVSSDGSIALFYPPVAGEQQTLQAGETFSQTIKMFVPQGRDAVQDVIKVIATVKPIDPTVFHQGRIRSAPPSPQTRAMQDPLTKFLSDAVRGTRGGKPVSVGTWTTRQKPLRVSKDNVRMTGFSVYPEQASTVEAVTRSLGTSRALCMDGPDVGDNGDCDRLVPVSKDGGVFHLIPRISSRADDETVSVGKAFDEAYAIQELTGAMRVEPNLEITVPGTINPQGIDTRDVSGDDNHDELAAADDQWSLKQIRAIDAWAHIRATKGVEAGMEGSGIFVAHPDTGYREHPEIWKKNNGIRPVDKDKGWNFYEGNDNSEDPLHSSRPLDNPGHGTGSSSVIVSPAGCQLEGAEKCVNGVGRGARLIPLRVHRSVSQINPSKLAQAIQAVADGEIEGDSEVISIAMGGPPTLGLWRAVKAAEKKGILVIAAAGNYVRTVVWPARFDSTIAVAASNVHCGHWKHSSRGSRVDISAPGESVWRAGLNDEGYFNGMSKGTTYATGNTAGAAVLWQAYHKNNQILAALKEKGKLTGAFRSALNQSSWQPGAVAGNNPPGTHCENTTWNSNYGSGILDVDALLKVPLATPASAGTRRVDSTVPELPLFSSLYPSGTNPDIILQDYLAIFGTSKNERLKDLAPFETEILYHYTVNESVRDSMEELSGGQRSTTQAAVHISYSLQQQDLSNRLRKALNP